MNSSSGDEDRYAPRCSFCDKSMNEVRLVAGPRAFICPECVDLCWDIFWGDKKPLSEKKQGSEAPLREPIDIFPKTEVKK